MRLAVWLHRKRAALPSCGIPGAGIASEFSVARMCVDTCGGCEGIIHVQARLEHCVGPPTRAKKSRRHLELSIICKQEQIGNVFFGDVGNKERQKARLNNISSNRGRRHQPPSVSSHQVLKVPELVPGFPTVMLGARGFPCGTHD